MLWGLNIPRPAAPRWAPNDTLPLELRFLTWDTDSQRDTYFSREQTALQPVGALLWLLRWLMLLTSQWEGGDVMGEGHPGNTNDKPTQGGRVLTALQTLDICLD